MSGVSDLHVVMEADAQLAAELSSQFPSHYPNANKPAIRNHSNSNKAADHGERIFVDSQHMAPHRDIASDQSDCSGWGLNSCGLDATVPFSTVARRWQSRVMLNCHARGYRTDAVRYREAGGRAQAVASRADASLGPPRHRRLRAVRRLGLHRHAGDR